MSPAPSDPLALGLKKHFLFDLDGTLVDSSGAHERAYRLALGIHAAELEPEFSYEWAKGRRTHDVFRGLGVSDAGLLVRLVEAKQAAYLSLVGEGQVVLFEGAKALLERLVATGRSCFLATGASRRSTDQVLRSVGIETLFTGTVTADDVTRGKPDPESFASIARRWQLPAAECVVVEDAESGVEAAHAAGMQAVVVHTQGLQADWVVEDLLVLRALVESGP
jgi:HAD superfamily hydrolase (TIGR01509 family)